MSAERAKRDRGVCRGSLWCQEKPLVANPKKDSTSKYLHYCVLVGANLNNYETKHSYEHGDHPLTMVHIVGASAWNPTTSSRILFGGSSPASGSSGSTSNDSTSFRLVTEQGTHLYCAAPTLTCRDLWLGALHAGLDRSLLETGIPKQQPLQPPPPAKTGRLRPRIKKHCVSCGAIDSENNPVRPRCLPVPHYAKESRCDLCQNCLVTQGLLNHIYYTRELFASAQQERKALMLAKQLCWKAMKEANPDLERQVQQQAALAAASLDESTTTATTETTTGEATQENHSNGTARNESPPTPSTEELSSTMDQNGDDGKHGKNGTKSDKGDDDDESSWSIVDDPLQSQVWIHLPPTPESTKAIMKLITSSAEFLSLQRVSLTLEYCCEQIQQGIIEIPEMLEQMEHIMGSTNNKILNELDQHAQLKKQAFRVAGDMGTAMKLLHDLALPRGARQQQQSAQNLDMFLCLLEFLLDLCEGGELASVAAFWPQLCHIHLRMLPCDNIAELQRVELLEDFLLTVATKHSIHLALDLVWSHQADLEESLLNPNCSATCHRRRFAVMRFICELEALLFGMPGGWGLGSVSFGRFLIPSPHQDALIKLYMDNIQELRKEVPQHLSRSVRLETLSHSKFEQDPIVAAQEALRVAKNADYFSCHLNFSRRVCDIAEKMFEIDPKERADALETELRLLNASGTMGGDPLNRVLEHHLRVVGMPAREGHVFRSKERTPVLLLMEVFDDTVEDDEEQQNSRLESLKEKANAISLPKRESEKISGPSLTPTETMDGLEKFEDAQLNAASSSYDETDLNADQDHTESEHFEDAKSEQDEDVHFVASSSSFDEDGMYSPKHVRKMSQDAKYASPSHNPTLPLEGSLDDSGNIAHAPHALKRFDTAKDKKHETPQTPTMDTVEEMVSNAMVKHLRLPDLEITDEEELENSETTGTTNGGDESKEAKLAIKKSSQNSSRDMPRIKSDQSMLSDDGLDPTKRASKKMSALNAADAVGDSSHGFAPTGDVRREVLNHIFLRGIQGNNAIATGAQAAVQHSLQELDHKRAVELLMHDSEVSIEGEGTEPPDASDVEGNAEKKKKKMTALGLDNLSDDGMSGDDAMNDCVTEEDEALESIRLLLIQNRVAQGRMSAIAAAKVLQHASTQRGRTESSASASDFTPGDDDDVDMPKVDAGEIDPRLVGCGELPPAVMHALQLWKAGLVTNGELLELVTKDLEHGRRCFSQDPEIVEKLNEDSAFWGRFAFGERWAEKKARIALSSVHGKRAGWDLVGVIVKANDDLRQEKFVMQLIELCQEAFQVAGLELWVHPYRILSTGRTTGIIEMVRNAMSFDGLKKRPGYGKGGLKEHLQRMTEFMPDPENSFKAAQRNFVRSLAAYSLMSYFFLFKDRHNGNILLDTAGHVIHIDFGFVFGIAPGGSFSLEMSTPFKITEEMLDVMGGTDSHFFSEFVILFCCGFLALQAHFETFLTLVEITSNDSTFPCFEGRDSEEIVDQLRERFHTELDTEKTIAYALDLIQQATSSYGTKQYDYFQYLSQGIAT